MSLPLFDSQGSLFGSVLSISGSLFTEEDRYRLFAQKIWPVLAGTRSKLEKCYCSENGRAGVEPVLLLGVLIFQFLERMPDRQAVEMLKYHLGWKLALNVALEQRSFHPTTLVYFRQRLVEQREAALAFNAVLEALQQEGLVPKKGKQRLDSTHVIGLVARLNALECVRETLRLALEELAERLPEAERPDYWPLLWERYVENKLDYKSTEQVFRQKQRQAGEDIQGLLKWLEPLPVKVREGRQVLLLRKVFAEQYVIVESGELEPVKVHATGVVQTPHDPEAQWSAKGQGKAKKDWVGYKVQVAENLGQEPRKKGEPQRHFLTSLVTQSATESDDAGLPATLEKQSEAGLESPAELYVDGAYVSAAALSQAQAEGRELLGPAQRSAHKGTGFGTEAFQVCVEERRAICPAGKENAQCSRLEEKQTGKVSYRFEWSSQCHDCPLREQCVGAGQKHRTLVVGEHHTILQARREEQKSEAFVERMKTRNGIEGTQSELVRAHGLRRTRYRGKAKVDLQHQFIGAACNIKRWLKLIAWEIKQEAAQLRAALNIAPQASCSA
jgi:transposase